MCQALLCSLHGELGWPACFGMVAVGESSICADMPRRVSDPRPWTSCLSSSDTPPPGNLFHQLFNADSPVHPWTPLPTVGVCSLRPAWGMPARDVDFGCSESLHSAALSPLSPAPECWGQLPGPLPQPPHQGPPATDDPEKDWTPADATAPSSTHPLPPHVRTVPSSWSTAGGARQRLLGEHQEENPLPLLGPEKAPGSAQPQRENFGTAGNTNSPPCTCPEPRALR